MLADWSKDKTLRLRRPRGQADGACSPPASARCHVASSGTRVGIDKALGKPTRSASPCCPTTPTSRAKPQNSIIGGATLWVLQGKPKAEYKGVAKFLTFLSSARGRRPSGTRTPATCRSPLAAYELTEKSGFYKKNPGPDIAVKELIAQAADRRTRKGLRLGNFVQIRDVDRRGARGGVGGQEGRQGRARRGGEARQRACCASSKRRTSRLATLADAGRATRAPSRPLPLAEGPRR